MNVLFVTRSDDHDGVALTVDAVERLGGRAIRFDTDRFPTEHRLTTGHGDGTETLTLRAALPYSSENRRFLRLTVGKPH